MLGESHPKALAPAQGGTPSGGRSDPGAVSAARLGARRRGGVRKPSLPSGKRLRCERKPVVFFPPGGAIFEAFVVLVVVEAVV